MKSIPKRQSGKNPGSSFFEQSRDQRTPTPKTMTTLRPSIHPLISELDLTERPRDSLEICMTSDSIFPFKNKLRDISKKNQKHKIKMEISCEDIRGEKLLSKRVTRRNQDSNLEIVRDILMGTKKKKKGGSKNKRVKPKKRRIQSMKETKGLRNKNDLRFPLTNEWIDYSSNRYKRKKSGMFQKKVGSRSRNKQKKARKSTSKTQFFSQSRKSSGNKSNFLRQSPKQNKT